MQVVYDCIDPVLENNRIQQQKQNKLLKLSRINFVNSPYLYREISKFNTKTFLVPCGCKTTYFNAKKIFNTPPADFPKIKNQQVLGISSTIDWRINLELILFIAQSNLNWHLVIIGPIHGNPDKKWASVLRTANIHYLGVKDKSKLANYYSFFDVCLIPYIFNKKPLKNNPMKFYEYMAMGKPVVSVPIEALECYQPHVKFANNKRDFVKCINIQLGNQKKKSISDRIMIAKTNNWENKIKEMFKQIDKHL
ncbi:MAG: glycosyltransferase family 1 protein [Candidatus Pacebacteria bacterium]|nr:glycosyltransferase family 1 protein [Candidatus Paceibacterota bacterium]